MNGYNVYEVLSILKEYYITSSKQMVNRWIREGKIQGVRTENRKDGYRVTEDSLFTFIEIKRPGLKEKMDVYQRYMQVLKDQEDKLHQGVPDDYMDKGQDSFGEPGRYIESSKQDKGITYEKELKKIAQFGTELKDIIGQNQMLISLCTSLVEENKRNNELYQKTGTQVQQLNEEVEKLQRVKIEKKKSRSQANTDGDDFGGVQLSIFDM